MSDVINIEITEVVENVSITITDGTEVIGIVVEEQNEVISVVFTEVGEKGDTGKDIFQVAQDNGFTGTFEQFKETLKPQDTDYRAYYILSKT